MTAYYFIIIQLNMTRFVL